MAKAKSIYRKLTGLHRSVGMMSQLWLGPDHLLHVHSTGYTENYRRLYFRDIQAMLLVHTDRRLYVGATVVVLALLVLIVANALGASWTVLGVMTAVFAAFFIWNQLLGPGCRVVFVTAVQQENVPSLSRIPKTRRVLAELTKQIETAQADLVGASVSAPPVSGSQPPLISAVVTEPPPLPPPLPT